MELRHRLLIGLIALPAVALADPRVVVRSSRGAGDAAPTLEVRLLGAPKADASQITVVADGDSRTAVRASRTRTAAQDKDTLAIAFVIDGQTIWMGNASYEKDETARYPGAHRAVAAALDTLKLSTLEPGTAKGLLVTYGLGAHVRVAPGPLGAIRGRSLGTERDYASGIATNLVAGLQVAVAELEDLPASTRVLVVIGDGADTNNDKAKGELAAIGARLEASGILAFAIVHKSPVSSEGTPIRELVPDAVMVPEVAGIAPALADIVGAIRRRYVVEVPGWDVTSNAGLPWDGKPHALTITIAGQALPAIEHWGGPRWTPPAR